MWIIPCTISVLRALALAPLFFLFPAYPIAAFLVFTAGALTDALDGWLARLLNAESELGKILDPIADKIFYLGALVVLNNIAPTFLLFILALPWETLLTVIRFRASHQTRRAANPCGKWKTTVQFCAIACMMFGAISNISTLAASGFALGLVAVPLAWMSFYAHIHPNEKAAF